MGREVRRVPADWKHPHTGRGSDVPDRLQPMFDEVFEDALFEWLERSPMQTTVGDGLSEDRGDEWKKFLDYHGGPPDPDYYRLGRWTEEEATHLQMYETTTEGTPISPPFETPEELAKWLADNEASSFGSMVATEKEWLAMINGEGFAPSAIRTVHPDGTAEMMSGVEAISKQAGDE